MQYLPKIVIQLGWLANSLISNFHKRPTDALRSPNKRFSFDTFPQPKHPIRKNSSVTSYLQVLIPGYDDCIWEAPLSPGCTSVKMLYIKLSCQLSDQSND
ncbi:17900_t:CDS:1 [Racocetra persica]|uniref:17900_t:CDS:1 n=1 Tax=Racocetra persica TaxID=160502 RepID=A0ACA9LFG9_9GLOM|nr:17900_t:CDS:1 [Racocetra persica]